MRPALLVIIMDFLVSSLLLYVTDGNAPSGALQRAPIAAQVETAVAPSLSRAVEEVLAAQDEEFDQLAERFAATQHDAQLEEARREAAYFQTLLEETGKAKELAEQERVAAEMAKTMLEEKVEAKEEQVATLENAVAAQNKTIEARQSQQAELEAELARKQALQDQLTQDLLARDASLDEQQARAQELEKAVSALEKQRALLAQQLASANASLASLHQENTSLATRHTEVVAKLDALQTQSAKQHAALTTGQQEILTGITGVQASLSRLQGQVNSLPEELQKMLQPMLSDARSANTQSQNLLSEINTKLKTQDPSLVKRLEQQLAQANRGVEQQLEAMQDLLKGNATRDEVEEAAKQIQRQAAEARARQARVGAVAARRLAETDPLFRRINQARMRLDIELEEKDYLFSGNDRFTQSPLYAMQVDEGLILAHAASLGLYWSEIDGDLIKSSYIATPMDGEGLPARVPRASSLARPCQIIRLYPAASGMGAPAPLQLFEGLTDLLQGAQGGLALFKQGNPLGNMAFQSALRHDPVSSTLSLENPSVQASADAGDYLVTEGGYLVGIMQDARRCMPITRSMLRTVGASFSLGLPDRLADQAGQYKDLCPAK